MKNSQEIVKVLAEAATMMDESKDNVEELSVDLNSINMEIQDVIHDIELNDFDMERGYQLALELKELRSKRRVIKDEIDIFNYLKSFTDRNSTFAKRLNALVREMNQEIDNRSTRRYLPRVRDMDIIYATPIHTEETVSVEEELTVLTEELPTGQLIN